jgi:hypothetical protein
MSDGTAMLIFGVMALITVCVFFSIWERAERNHKEKMASLGYEEKALLGTDKTIWVKKEGSCDQTKQQ